ncbi:hypothetical protein IG631_05404 [Alternaria alternata]|nr:hypothetical protein IG631_05404 [Alternaria alternata]
MVWSPAVTRAPSVLRIVVCGLVVFMYRAGSRTVPEVDSVQHTNTVSKSSWPKRRGEEAGKKGRARRGSERDGKSTYRYKGRER